MYCLKEEPRLSNNEMEHLVKHLKNEEIRCILKTMKPSDWVGDNGMTLIHLAVVHSNLELIKYLLDTGCDVNAKNSSGDTALLIAMKSMNFKAMEILLEANADIRIIDALSGKSALGFLIAERRKLLVETAYKITDIVPYFVNNLKRSNFDVETVVDLFVSADWPLEFVLPMKNAVITRRFLERENLGYHANGMLLAMKELDFKSVELILRHGNESGRSAFYHNLSVFFMTNEFETWKEFIELLPNWNVVSEGALYHLDFLFKVADVNNLKVLLDSNIHVQVKEKFGLDLRVSIFGNRKVDAVDLLKNQEFDVNVRGYKNLCALHLTVMSDLISNIFFLLNSGADINAKDDEGMTALFHCILSNRTECGRVLLRYGADVQITDKNELTIFELAERKNSLLLECLLARLAIDHAQGAAIKQTIQDQINSKENYKNIYESCCQQIQALKKTKIAASMTLFDLLIKKIDILSCSINDLSARCLIHQHKQQNELHLLYHFAGCVEQSDTSGPSDTSI